MLVNCNARKDFYKLFTYCRHWPKSKQTQPFQFTKCTHSYAISESQRWICGMAAICAVLKKNVMYFQSKKYFSPTKRQSLCLFDELNGNSSKKIRDSSSASSRLMLKWEINKKYYLLFLSLVSQWKTIRDTGWDD